MDIFFSVLALSIFFGLVATIMWLIERTAIKLKINQLMVIVLSIIPIFLYLISDFLWFEKIPDDLRIILTGFVGFILSCAALLLMIKQSTKFVGSKATILIFVFGIPFIGGIVVDGIFYDVLTFKELLLIPFSGTIGKFFICIVLTVAISPDALIGLLCVAGNKIKEVLKGIKS